jgi:hypothetical protein
MQESSYPALFRCADATSNGRQFLYFFLIKSEYTLLLAAAVFSMNIFSGPTFYTIYALLFVVSIVVLLTRALKKPEQDWYRCRALAESVKTLTWRYVMRAAPFEDAPQVQVPRAEFRNHLHQLFAENRLTAEMIAPDWSADDQITSEMDNIRGLSLTDRKAYYTHQRVLEQRRWYARKATFNRKAASKWVKVGVVSYIIAGILALSRIRFPEWQLWPIEPIIVFASSVTGWMQIKKFNELSTAYAVTAHEIGMVKPSIDAADSEAKFSEAVNDAELAFSREHTLWVARQTN